MLHARARVSVGDDCQELPRFMNESKVEFEELLTHDDYKRLLVSVCIIPDRMDTPASRVTFQERKERRRRWFAFAHEARFGCTPIECQTCYDTPDTMRALNCDVEGNPNDA